MAVRSHLHVLATCNKHPAVGSGEDGGSQASAGAGIMADVNSCRSLCVVSHEEASDAVDCCFLLRSLWMIAGSSTVAPLHSSLAEVIIRAAKNLPTGSERCPSRSQIAKPADPAG